MNFSQTVTAAVEETAEDGFNAKRMEFWMRRLRVAAEKEMISEAKMEKQLRDALRSVYRRLVDGNQLMAMNPGVSSFTIKKLNAKMKRELDARIMASASLIKLNRQQRIQETLQRFGGWSTSIPRDGSEFVNRAKSKDDIKKALAQLPFQERRVLIDQGHKLTAAINSVVAENGGAIAGKWHSNWRQPDYNYREDHKERDERVYLIRDSWAHQDGLVRPMGNRGFTDDITQPAEEPFCRCSYRYLYSLRQLPSEMLTAKGKAAMKAAKGIAA